MRFKEFKTESIVQPVQPMYRPKATDNPPKQNTYVPPEKKKPEDDKEKPLVDLIAEKKKRKKKKTKLARYFYPGFGYYGYGSSDSSSGDTGGDGGGGESVREGNVVSMQARKTPLVIAGSPYDWDVYDLRTNKMVANILGGDRHESPLFEVRINSNGMTQSTRMPPTYVVTTGRNNNPPYKAFALQVPKDRDKIEKSPGPGGTTKLRPDNMDVLAHLAKMTGQGKYYGYETVLVEEGLDPYELVEKALGAKIMDIDDAMELGYTDEDPEDSSSIIYTANVNESKPKALFNPKPMKKGEGDSPDDYEYTDYVPRGKDKGTKWAIDRDVKNQKLKPKKPSELQTGFYKNYLGNRPIREGEKHNSETSSEVKKFALWASKKLSISKLPKIQLSYSTKEAQQGHHTGRHTEGGDAIWVYVNNRNLVDILRTVFHELVHWRQSELGLIKPNSSYPGSPIEAQADMLAGKYIKIYGKENNHIFQ